MVPAHPARPPRCTRNRVRLMLRPGLQTLGSPGSFPGGSGERLVGLATSSHLRTVSYPGQDSHPGNHKLEHPRGCRLLAPLSSSDSYFWKHEGEQKSYALSQNNAFP